MEGPKASTVSQEVEVVPYGFYKLRVKVRQMGEGEARVRLCWADGTEAWRLTAAHSPREGWQSIEEVIRIPQGQSQLRLELLATGQKSVNDVIWFDDVELIPISVN